jgi:ankyrin repeat protein
MKDKILILGYSVLAMSLLACAPTRTQSSRDIALIRAAEKGQTQQVYQLIKDGADVNAHDPEGWTPYLAASSMGHLDAMKLLRANGAKTSAPELEPGNLQDPESIARYLVR